MVMIFTSSSYFTVEMGYLDIQLGVPKLDLFFDMLSSGWTLRL